MAPERFVLVQGMRAIAVSGVSCTTAPARSRSRSWVAATAVSLLTQAYVLGNAASTLADQGGMSPLLLIVGLLGHAVPELFALFELLAATFVTVAIAVPILVVAAFVEVYVSPHLILALRG